MMSKRERERVFVQLGSQGIGYETISKLLRYGSTLHRLAEAGCNGDWPADNGNRKVKACSGCEGLWAPSVLLKGGLCPDCRTEALARALCATVGLEAIFQGDPRGPVLLVKTAGGLEVIVG